LALTPFACFWLFRCLFVWLFGCVLDFWAKRQITFLFGFDVVAIATVIPFA